MPRTIGYEKNNKISKSMSKLMRGRFEGAKQKLMFGQEYRMQKREPAWRRSLSQYNNNVGFDVASTESMDLVNVNISFSTINTLVPYVSDENPRFLVKPGSGEAVPEHGALLEYMINNVWRDPDVEGQVYVTDAVWDYLVFGDGFASILHQLVEDPQYDGRGDVLSGRGTERVEYGVDRISPWDIWIDPYSDGIHNARWVARRIMIPLSELKEDDRYKIVGELNAGTTGALEHADPDDEDRLHHAMTDDGWVSVYEFYDTVNKWMMAFTLDSEAPLRYIEGIRCPIVQLSNYRISNSPYHVGELENIYSLQMEINRTRSEMITHRRRNTAKWIARKDLVKQEAQEAMQSNVINDIIWVEGNAPFSQYLEQVAPQALTADSYNQDQIIRNDINEITGVNEYLRGQPQDISRTATEASIIEGATNVRTRHKLNQVETFLRRLGQRLLDVIADTLPETDFEEMRMYVTGSDAERLLRAMGENPNTDVIVTPSPEIFEGRYIVDVERGSAELRNPQAQAAKFKEMFQILTSSQPVLQQNGINVNLKRVLEMWFEAANIEDINSIFVGDENQALMQESAQMQAIMGAMGGAAPGGGGPVATGSRTPPGQPRDLAAQPPAEMVSPENSGMLPSR